MKKQNSVIEQINLEISMPSKVFPCTEPLLVVPEIVVSSNFLLCFAGDFLCFLQVFI